MCRRETGYTWQPGETGILKSKREKNNMSKSQQAASTVSATGEFITVPISTILIDHARNVRYGRPDAKHIEAIKASIIREGLHEPLIVSRMNGNTGDHVKPGVVHLGFNYRLEAGYQRAQAILNAMETQEHDGEVAVHVEQFSDEAAALGVSVTENERRKNMSPMDRAVAVAKMKEQGLKGQEIAERMGVSGALVSQLGKLLELRPSIQAMIHNGELPWSTARSFPALAESEQDKILAEIQEAKDAGNRKNLQKRAAKAAAESNAAKWISGKKAVAEMEEGLQRIKAAEEKEGFKGNKKHETVKGILALIKRMMEGKIGGQAFQKKVEELL